MANTFRKKTFGKINFVLMYFESVFIKPNNFYINIYNINLSKKFMK